MKTMGQNWKSIGFAVAAMVVSLVAINYLVIAPIAGLVYGNLELEKKPLGNLKEIGESHGMTGLASIEVVPENEGMKLLLLEIDGVFCGSCGPAIVYDVKSIQGVHSVETDGAMMTVTYDSDVTSKDVITASIHDPYSAKIISEERI